MELPLLDEARHGHVHSHMFSQHFPGAIKWDINETVILTKWKEEDEKTGNMMRWLQKWNRSDCMKKVSEETFWWD